MNEMYEYLKNHAYISYNKKSNYQFELSKERAKCIANKYDSLIKDLEQENKQLKEDMKVLFNENSNKENVIIKQNDNWNKLKEFIVKEYYMYLPLEASTKSITILIDKMQELEGSDSK